VHVLGQWRGGGAAPYAAVTDLVSGFVATLLHRGRDLRVADRG